MWFTLALNALAADPSDSVVSFDFCQKEIFSSIGTISKKPRWTRHFPTINEPTLYTSPTDQFGQWIFVKKSSNKVLVEKASSQETLRFQFEPNKCNVVRAKRIAKQQLATGDHINDVQLHQLMRSSRNGIIYIWSPGMTYSVDQASIFNQVAKARNLSFISLLDPTAETGQAKRIVQKGKNYLSLKKLNSLELIMRAGKSHFPMTFVYKDGRLIDQPIIGVMNYKTLLNEVNQRLL